MSKPKPVAQQIYSDVMEEVKLRIRAIDYCTTNNFLVPAPLVREFCFLQIRMICELIAFGCLIAHGDIEEVSKPKLQTEYSAKVIMNALEKLNAWFFPLPINLTNPQPNAVHMQRINGRMNKQDLLRIYGRCGEVLHRGDVKKLLSGKIPVQVHFPDITALAQKFVDLLAIHGTVLHGGETMYVCRLNSPQQNGNVEVITIKTPAGQPMDYQSPDFLSGAPQ